MPGNYVSQSKFRIEKFERSEREKEQVLHSLKDND